MIGVEGGRPCGTCGGTGVVVVSGGKDAAGNPAPATSKVCPTCNGTRKAGGLRTK